MAYWLRHVRSWLCHNSIVVLMLVLTTMALLAVYVISGLRSDTSTTTGLLVDQTPSTLVCRSVDVSFCDAEIRFRDFVTAKDVSDILENQTPTPLICDKSQPVCRGVTSGLVVQLFAVQQGTASWLLTRNDYISLLRAYFARSGRFLFVADRFSEDTATMLFRNQAKTAELQLKFRKQNHTWKLTAPVLTAVV